MPESWDDLARQEYAKPDEPISARASDLTKFGAPVAAFITAALAAVGGWVADAPPAERVIGVAIVTAVAVGGLFYVFAADFKSRAAGTVARFNNLSKHAAHEAEASETVKAEARAETKLAEQAKEAAEDAEKRADMAQEDADARATQATKRVEAADGEVAELTRNLVEAREQLRLCSEDSDRPTPEGSVPASYVTLAGVDIVAAGAPTKAYCAESVGGDVVRYLVRSSDGRLRWVTAAEIGDAEEPSSAD